MPTLTAAYMADLGRVRLEADDLLPEVVYSIERSSDGGVTWATVRGATNITDGGVTVVYDYEYAPNAENLYQLTQPLVSDTFERTAGPNGLNLDGTPGSYAFTPDAPVLDPVGVLDVRAMVYRDDWSPPATEEVMASKYRDDTNDRSWRFSFNTDGMLRWSGSLNGIAIIGALSTAPPTPDADAAALALRAIRNPTTGDVTFYTAPHLGGSWTQLGAVRPGTSGALFAGAAPIEIGARDDGEQTLWDGTIMAVEVRHNATTLVANPDFDAQPTGTTAFNDSLGNPWTITGAGAHIVATADAWGDADTGQPWEPYASNGDALWWVADGAGRIITLTDPGFDNGRYIDQAFTDVEVQYDVILTEAFSQNRLSIRGDGTNAFTGYQIILTRETTGADTGLISLSIFIPSEGAAQTILLGPWQLGQRWRVKTRVVGTVIETKAWNTANPEPSTWQLVRTSVQFASGVIGFGANLFETGTPGLFDNFFVHQVPPLVVAEAAVTVEQDDVWLKSIAFPSLNQNLGCIRTGPRSRRSRVGLFDVRGRHALLGIADVGSTETFTMMFATHSQEQNVAITGLLTYGAPLLLQSPPDADPTGCGNLAAYPSGWFMPGDNIEARPLLGRPLWEWQVPLTRVAPPSAQQITPAHMTWSVLWQMVNTWVELWDEWATWAELWNATIAPTAMYQALSGGEG